MGAEHQAQSRTPTAEPARPGRSPGGTIGLGPARAGPLARAPHAARRVVLPPSGPAGPEAVVALQRSHGNAFVERALAPARLRRTPEQVTGVSEVEGESEAYANALADLRDFKGEPHEAINHTPSSGGRFDATYDANANTLFVTVKCAFTFKPGKQTDWDIRDRRNPREVVTVVRWQPAEEAAFKAAFFAQARRLWSGEHTFWCQADWWEALSATTDISIVEYDSKDTQGAHFQVTVEKRGYEETLRPGVKQRFAVATLHEGNVDPGKGGYAGASVAAHEAGHMFGIGDEGVNEETQPGEKAWHSDLVKAEFGHDVVRAQGGPASIMAATGAKVLPEHGVTFLEALKKATGMQEWSHTPKAPKPTPATGPPPGTPGQEAPDAAPPRPPVRFI